MRKSCCVDDTNFTPKSSSCSMVLRSACTHGHYSHNSSAVKKSQSEEVKNLNEKLLRQSRTGKTSNWHAHEKSVDIESYFHSSLKQFALKSAKTYSFLKESCYNRLDFSNGLKNEVTDKKEMASESLEGSYSLAKSKDVLFLNNQMLQEKFSHVNNNCKSSTNTMSKSRDFSRSSVTALNALSDSENEDRSSKGTVKRRVSKRSSAKSESLAIHNNNNNSLSSVNNVTHATYEATVHGSRVPGFNSNSYYHTPTSSTTYRSNINNSQGSEAPSPSSPSVIDISNVQYTLVDKCRWFLWRSIYLIIIRCLNFDVWLLSRLSNKRKQVALLLLILFLIYLLSGISFKNFIPFDKLNSNAYEISSTVYSYISSPFAQQKSIVSNFPSTESSSSSVTAYDAMSAISFYLPWNYLPSFYSKVESPAPENSEDQQKIIEKENKMLRTMLSELKQENKMLRDKVDVEIKQLFSEVASLRLKDQTFEESVKMLAKNVSQVKTEVSTSKYTTGVLQNIFFSSSPGKKDRDEKYIIAALKTMVEKEKDKSSPYFFFTDWLHTHLRSDKEMLSQLKLELEQIKGTVSRYDETIIENLVKKYMEAFKISFEREMTTINKVELTGCKDCSGMFRDEYEDVVKKLINEAILLYDADKTGKVDYALESGGGSVLSTRCSEIYAEKDGTVSLLGLPLWSTHSSPRTAIQPGMQPGDCWAFKGSQGFLVIQLSYTVHVTGFTLEHIPLSLSPSGSIDSAPKDFSVWGLFSEKDNEGQLLGQYAFDQHGDSLQYFPVQYVYDKPFSFVELKISSNWGNLKYTCLYRFRVHGKH